MMLSCRRASELVSAQMDRRVWWGDRLRLSLHLLTCRSCWRFRQAVRFLDQAVRLAYREERLPAESRERLRQALRDVL